MVRRGNPRFSRRGAPAKPRRRPMIPELVRPPPRPPLRLRCLPAVRPRRRPSGARGEDHAARGRTSAVAHRRPRPKPPVACGDARRGLWLAPPRRRARPRAADRRAACFGRRPAAPAVPGGSNVGRERRPSRGDRRPRDHGRRGGDGLGGPRSRLDPRRTGPHRARAGGTRRRRARAVRAAKARNRRQPPGADRRGLRVCVDRHRLEANRRLPLRRAPRSSCCSGALSPARSRRSAC